MNFNPLSVFSSGAHPNLKMRIVKMMILGLTLICTFGINISPATSQDSLPPGDCTPTGCWNAIETRAGWPATYCGTCTYEDNSMGLIEHGTSICMACG